MGTHLYADSADRRQQSARCCGFRKSGEFFVTLAMTITFIVLIGPQNFLWDIVIALLIAGLAAAPVAAWLCKRLPQRSLGMLVGLAVVVLSARMFLAAW